MMAGQAAEKLEAIMNELLAEDGAYVSRTYMEDDPKSPYVVHFNTEVIRKDGSKVFIHEVLPRAPKRKCPGYTVNLGDQRGICIHCGAPAGAH